MPTTGRNSKIKKVSEHSDTFFLLMLLFRYCDSVGEDISCALLQEGGVDKTLNCRSVKNGYGRSVNVAEDDSVGLELSLSAYLNISLYLAVYVKILSVYVP